jgi:hypothetical protein
MSNDLNQENKATAAVENEVHDSKKMNIVLAIIIIMF